ncbi:potassium channel family protein [Heyndrickxia ginsengihumi]|uniref:Potassium transporter Trk n=1 Tax=Heyndrickxia ginsengihumi TaxID=363870 RepID=A0A0A6V9H5_9BACI|nr:TrkA family potassium uptake protein [Heyndrickxia ginsengihumi]KHD84218.1 potassium transporter Trk [Heyndrickxia ginsengihumi]MBE6183643.1 TrkA family potassium uptake protein [Bacillus sp. (in: firmicutes)]MCM3022353.1 TrkA family potassium uptake protein [Heyndrickxia ginsengihumi]NEY18705.1 TrkA family potassium uptake protein [Heyndrickxia ginsengihumi]
MKKEFTVIGLGRFGGSVCRELIDAGMDVLAIDRDEDRVNEFAQIATQAVIADTTDETVMRKLGVRNFEHVIVAIGEDIQGSILTTIILKELGVKTITVKAQNDLHEKVLLKIGATHVVHPERDMAKRIAHHMISNNILDYLELSEEFSIAEVASTTEMAGNSLLDLNVRAKYGVTIVAIKRNKENIIISPSAQDVIQAGDTLIIIGADEAINRFEQDLQ